MRIAFFEDREDVRQMAVGMGLWGCEDVNPGPNKAAPPDLLGFEIYARQVELCDLGTERLHGEPDIYQGP